jgi:hypothetical protein
MPLARSPHFAFNNRYRAASRYMRTVRKCVLRKFRTTVAARLRNCEDGAGCLFLKNAESTLARNRAAQAARCMQH